MASYFTGIGHALQHGACWLLMSIPTEAVSHAVDVFKAVVCGVGG